MFPCFLDPLRRHLRVALSVPVLALGLAASPPAQAATLTVIGDVNVGAAGNLQLYTQILGAGTDVLFSRGFEPLDAVVGHYRTLGARVTERDGALSLGVLSGIDLLVLTARYNAVLTFTTLEIAAVKEFAIGGGDVLLVAEAKGASALTSYNTILEGLGVGMRFTGERYAQAETLTDLQDTVLTQGMNSFRVSPYSTLRGGTASVIASQGTVIAQESIMLVAPIPLPGALPLLFGGVGLMALVRARGARRPAAAAGRA